MSVMNEGNSYDPRSFRKMPKELTPVIIASQQSY